MGKHIDAKTKYHYVMRYLNGESPTKLGLEINPQLKNLTDPILRWNSIYQKEGIKGLKSKTGEKKGPNKGRPRKKPKPKYEDMSKEELIERLKINDIFIDEINKSTRARFKYPVILKIKEQFKLSISKICEIINVSKSGYYSWLKSPKKEGNYSRELLTLVQTTYDTYKGLYGAERIMGQIYINTGKLFNIKTIYRYMKHLGIEAKIRNPNRRRRKVKKEIKNTKDIRTNYIMGNFKNDSSREKLFSDTTEFWTPNGKIYFSAVVGANKNLYSLTVSTRNNKTLIMKDVQKGIKKVGRKFFIQFDNAAFYKNDDMKKLLDLHKGISSFGLPGESKSNWPIENFWSILKQEFLNVHRPINVKEAEKLLTKIIFTYNHKRIQKKLKWKTPALARV